MKAEKYIVSSILAFLRNVAPQSLLEMQDYHDFVAKVETVFLPELSDKIEPGEKRGRGRPKKSLHVAYTGDEWHEIVKFVEALLFNQAKTYADAKGNLPRTIGRTQVSDPSIITLDNGVEMVFATEPWDAKIVLPGPGDTYAPPRAHIPD